MRSRRQRTLLPALLTLAAGVVLGAAVVPFPSGAPAARPPAVDCPDRPAQLAGRRFTATDKVPDLRCADLTDAVLDGLDLSQGSLAGAHAAGASFRDADLGQATLTGADLTGAHLDGANLIQAQLDGVTARSASFRGATLDQADLGRADLRDSDLVLASLIQADLGEADLRGAALWGVNSIQAQTWSTHVGGIEAGIVQVPVLGMIVLVVLMVRRTLALGRRPDDRLPGPAPGAVLRASALAAALSAGIVTVAGLLIFDLAGLWIAAPLRSAPACVLVAALAGAVRRLTRRPAVGSPVRTEPDPTPEPTPEREPEPAAARPDLLHELPQVAGLSD